MSRYPRSRVATRNVVPAGGRAATAMPVSPPAPTRPKDISAMATELTPPASADQIQRFVVDSLAVMLPDAGPAGSGTVLGSTGLALTPDVLARLGDSIAQRFGVTVDWTAVQLAGATVGTLTAVVAERAAADSPAGPRRMTRPDVVALLATYRHRPPEDVHERIDSLELAWLVHQIEQRYRMRLDLDDDQFARMTTVTAAVEVLGEAEVLVAPDEVTGRMTHD
jgi:hypothetical protein